MYYRDKPKIIHLLIPLGIACDAPPDIPGLQVEKVFRVENGEYAYYRCPPDNFWAENPSEAYTFQLKCLQQGDQWSYFYENGTLFNLNTHQAPKCLNG